MPDPLSRELAGRNYDLFRGSVSQLEPTRIAKAFDWLDGSGPFPGPVSVQYDLTLRCTAHCVHCEQWRWPQHRELGITELRALFDRFRAWEVRTVTLSGGNPLLHPYLSEALAMASERAIAIGIISEGAQISRPLADSIAAHACWVRFSVDGPSSEIHDHIRRAPGLFASVAAAIAELKARNQQLPVELNCVVQRENVQHVPEMIAAAERLGADGVFLKLPHGDDPGRRFLLTLDEFQRFRDWVSAASQRHYNVKTNLSELKDVLEGYVAPEDAVIGRPIRSHYIQNGVRCFVPLFFMICDSEGNAYPCCYLQADNRPWEGVFAEIRSDFCAGNILADGDRVLERMAELLRSRVHGLPCGGYDQCGCCTRYCQLNTALSSIDNRRKGSIPQDSLTQLKTVEQVHLNELNPPFL